MVQLRSKVPGAKRSRRRRCFYCLCDVTKCPQVFTFCGQHAEAVKCAVEVKLPLLSRAVPRVGRKTEIMVGGFEALKRETAKPEEPERGPVKFLV